MTFSTPVNAHLSASRRIGPFEVSPIGLGCMNLSHAYGTPPDAAAAERLLLAALDAGVTLFDTNQILKIDRFINRHFYPDYMRNILIQK